MKHILLSIIGAMFFACNVQAIQTPAIPGTPVWTLAEQDNLIVTTIESQVDALGQDINIDFDGTFTALDELLAKMCTVQSQAEQLALNVNLLEINFNNDASKMCIIDSKVDALLIDVQAIDTQSTFTALEALNQTLCSKIEQLNAELALVETDITDITQTYIDHNQTTASKLNVIDNNVNTINSILDNITFDTSLTTINSLLDVIDMCLATVDSKLDPLESAIETNFAGTFTALEVNLQKACTIESLADAIPMSFIADLSGVYTALNELEQTMCTIDSKVDNLDMSVLSIESDVDILNSNIDLTLSKLCVLESKTDVASCSQCFSLMENIGTNLSNDCSTLEELNDNQLLEKTCTIESNLDIIIDELSTQSSKLEVIASETDIVESKICAIEMNNTTLSKLDIIDSKLDNAQETTLIIASLVDDIDQTSQTIESTLCAIDLEATESKLDVIIPETQTICSNLDELIITLSTVESKVDYIIENMPILTYNAFAYVCNSSDDTVTPIDLATNTPLANIAVGENPFAIAITPDGAFAYVCNNNDDNVTPIDLATNTPLANIAVGDRPMAIAITPDGAFAYVCNFGDNNVTPIDLATNTPLAPIAAGSLPVAIAITPDGAFAYVCSILDDTVTPIDLSDNTTLPTITVGDGPRAIAITPDGAFAYVCNQNDDNVTPIDLATNTPLATIAVGNAPRAIAITPDSAFAYVTNFLDANVTPIDLATNTPLATIPVGSGPYGIAITPDGAFAYVCIFGGFVTPIDLATNTPLSLIAVGSGTIAIAITPDNSLEHKVKTIESKICALDVGPLLSKLDITESLVCTIESNMDVANSLIDDANMKAIDLETDFASTWTILDVIENKLCTSESFLEVTSNNLTILNSSIDQLEKDIMGTFTVIAAIQLKADTVDSKVDVAISLVNDVDFSGVFTALDALESKVCLIDDITSSIDQGVTEIKGALGTPIYNSDVGTTGYTISTPGRYYLAENIIFNPSVASSVAITISSDNVFLDLNNMGLEQGNATATVRGILVSDDGENIGITNGFMLNFTGNAIALRFNTSKILIRDISTNNCGSPAQPNAVDIQTVIDILMDSVTMENGTFGMTMVNPKNAVLKGCLAISNEGDGIAFQEGSNVLLQDCAALNQLERVGDPGVGHGFDIQIGDNENYVFERCRSDQNFRYGLKTPGNGDTTTGLTIKDSICNNNTQRGININTCNECIVLNNTCIGNTLQGILLDGFTVATANNYIAFNTCNENSVNYDEDIFTGANTFLGNFALNSTASGTPDNTNYDIDGGSNISGKFATIAQTGAFPTTEPTEWMNINMLP